MKKIFVAVLIIITILVVMFVHTYSNPSPGKLAFAKYLDQIQEIDSQNDQFLNNLSQSNSLTGEQISRLIKVMGQELMAAKTMDPQWMNKIEAGWGDLFVNFHIKGLEKSISGYRAGNSQEIIEGRELLSHYDSWKRKNKTVFMKAVWMP